MKINSLFKKLCVPSSGKNRGGISCFGISRIVPNNFSSTSAPLGNNSNGNSNDNPLNIPFTDNGEARLILPSINDRIEFMDILKGSLSSLENTDKSLYYKLEYCLYTHTNDGNKELM